MTGGAAFHGRAKACECGGKICREVKRCRADVQKSLLDEYSRVIRIVRHNRLEKITVSLNGAICGFTGRLSSVDWLKHAAECSKLRNQDTIV
jgi:hypothetical protein